MCTSHLFSQGETDTATSTSKKKYVSLYQEDDPLTMFEPEPDKKEFKVKKKRKVYYGYKTKKGFSRDIKGRNEIITVYHYLKTHQQPSIYHQKFSYVDITTYEIKHGGHRSFKKVEDHAYLLHGPYLKRLNGEIVEEGIYHMGVKHGRWMYYDIMKEHSFDKKYIRYRTDLRTGKSTREDSIVQNEIEYRYLKKKEYWNQGFPKESEITYYDRDKTKIKKVIPIVNNELHGHYLEFFENGHVKKYGVYYHGTKEGTWREYIRGTRSYIVSLEVKYPDHRRKLEGDFEPYIIKQTDDTGHLIYEYKKGKEKKYYIEEETESTEL